MLKVSRFVRSLINKSHQNILSLTKNDLKCRTFYVNAKFCRKMFTEYENRYAYGLMENKGYAPSLNLEKEKCSVISKEQFETFLKEDWTKADSKELFEVFSMLSTYCAENNIQISSKMFDNFIDCLTDNISLASDKELESIFFSLSQWPDSESIRTRNYIEIWAALDDECLNRLRAWSYDQNLNFVSLFFMLNVSRASDFVNKCINKLASKAKQLTPGQLVQTLFFIGVQRKQPFDMHNLELHLEDNFAKFSIEDLAIMAMGFFKSKTPIRNLDLVVRIADKVMEHSQSIHEVSLAALLKVVRFSMKIPKDDTIYKLLDVLQHEVPRLSVMCNIHLALVGTSTLTFHQECLTKIADKVLSNISGTRLKDLERLVLTFGTFNFRPPIKECLFQKIIEELRTPVREIEAQKHGRSYACSVAYLGLLGIYPMDLMSKVLSKKFLETTYGKQCYLYGREILTIHNTATIFCKDANMNRLSDKEAITMAKKFTDFVPDENYSKQFNITERMYIDVVKVLKQHRGGEKYVIGDHIVTHHQRGDIILCNSHDGIPLPVQHAFQSNSFGLLRKPPDDNIWIVLVIAGRNAIIKGTDTPSGHIQAKIREIKALGYKGAVMPWSIYSALQTIQDKYNYLNTLIKEAV